MWWNDGKESIDDWILNQWPKNGGKGLGTNRVSIGYSTFIEWNGMEWNDVCRSNYGFTISIIWTRSERMEGISMNEIKSIKQYSKLISIELSGMNEIFRHFEDLEYLNTINIQYSEILSNVTERGFSKLHSWELMDVRFGRSTFIHFQSFH